MTANVMISSAGDKTLVQLIQVESYSLPVGLVLYWLGYAVSIKDNKTNSTIYVNIDDAVKKSLEAAREKGFVQSHFEKAKTFFLNECKRYSYDSTNCSRNLVDVYNRAATGFGY